MDANQFDDVIRWLSAGSSRRTVLGFALGGAIAAGHLWDAAAKNRNKRKKKKVTFNGYGCVSVNKHCKNASQCCSGICKGKKGKKRCKAHDAGGCPPGATVSSCSGMESVACTTSTGFPGWCYGTTGGAAYCWGAGAQAECTKDADCIPIFGPAAACVLDCTPPGEPLTICAGPGVPAGA